VLKLRLIHSEPGLRLLGYVAASLLTALLALQAASAQSESGFHFQFTDTPGNYVVGFKVIEQYDHSRTFRAGNGNPDSSPRTEGPRPLQTLVWYPAVKTGAPTTTFGDYEALIKTETSFGKPVEEGKPQSFVAAFMQGTTQLHAWAVRDAPMQTGRFPVAIYAPSLNAPATENIELCEYLASNGYVVIAGPSMGAASRTMTVDVGGANAEAEDISFVIDFAKTLPDADLSQVATIGYSWGGMAALFAAARDKRIKALISLDGSFRYAPGTVQEAGDIHPDRMTIPLLFFSRAEETLETWDAMRKDKTTCESAPNVLNEWTHGDLLHVRLLAISHIQFSSLYQRSERFKKEGLHFAPADYSLEEGAESYNWMARYVLAFLNTYLKRDPAAEQFLKHTPAENGLPKHLMAVSFRAASPGGVVKNLPPQ
jgi:pimeloyl-ACP methyl ester carboxylesterase